jgi:uncharacterized membrane protein YedE/YeeE
MGNLKFLVLGVVFGLILIKAEVISWFRIQEMFRFQSFHMYGIIGSAVITGMVSLLIMRRLKTRSSDGKALVFPEKPWHNGIWIGGMVFGLGWALTGACPGPMFALLGNGYTVFLVPLISAVAGAWTYGLMREKLPH